MTQTPMHSATMKNDKLDGATEIYPVSNWGRKELFQAKVGTLSSTLVMVRRIRKFHVGQFIRFAELKDVDGMSIGCTPPWRGGVITRIDGNRLFIERM